MKQKFILLSLTLIFGAILPFSHWVIAADILQFTKLGTHPSDRELSNEGADSEAAQGLAFDGSHWFYSNDENIYRLQKDFRNKDKKFKVKGHSFGGTKCDHVGGIDYFDGEVYTALDNCSDGNARVAVFDINLNLKRSGVLPALKGQFPWVAVNPIDSAYLYSVSKNKKQLFAFDRIFSNGASLSVIKAINFQDHPDDKLDHFWSQGGAFSPNGLFFRSVDDAKDEDSHHTGIWVYAINDPIKNGSAARRVGFINIKYDPDQWAPGCWFDQCYRNYELEDVDAATVSSGSTAGDVHIIMLSNEIDEDDVTVYHYAVGDYDQDGSKDSLDNCFRNANSGQEDLDQDGVGFVCDSDEVGNIIIPTVCLPLI
jgi:hypothetical protein